MGNKISLSKIVVHFQLEIIYESENINKIFVKTSDVNRPGLQMVGFAEYFDNTRIQIMGKVEFTFLEQFSSDQREKRLEKFFMLGFPALNTSLFSLWE